MIVGLTGGIGSGKSVVATLLEIMGCRVFNSDMIAKQSYFKPHIKEKICQLIGQEAYQIDGGLNKKFIAEKIFNDDTLRGQINAIIHPEVKKEIQGFVNLHPNELIIKESALLFEAGLDKEVDKIVVISAKDEIRIRRTMQRDKSTREQVLKQMQSQWPQEEKIKKADFVIENNEEEFLILQTLQLVEKLKLERL